VGSSIKVAEEHPTSGRLLHFRAARRAWHASRVSRAARQALTARWMRHYQTLPDTQRGLIMLALLVNALVTVLLQVALTVTGVRAARRMWRARRLGLTRVAQSGLSPALACVATAYLIHEVTRRWALRAVDDGRGRVLLERVDQWLSDRSDVVAQSRSDGTEPQPSDASVESYRQPPDRP
jgi:hypothetical protein